MLSSLELRNWTKKHAAGKKTAQFPRAMPWQHLQRHVERQYQECGYLALFNYSKQGACAGLGHVFRISECRLPKNILHVEMSSGTRSVGRPLLRVREL